MTENFTTATGNPMAPGGSGVTVDVATQPSAQPDTQPTFESKFIDFVFSSPAMVAEIEKRIASKKPDTSLEDQLHAILDGQREQMFSLLKKWIGVEGIVLELLELGADADKIVDVIYDGGYSVDEEEFLGKMDEDTILTFVTDNMRNELEDFVNNNGEIRSFEIRL